MSDEHAFLAPSAAHIWGPNGCAYYPTMAARFPSDDETLEKREGTAAHHYVTETILGRQCPARTVAPNGQPITDEMVEAGTDLIADVAGWHASCAGMFLVEQRVHMPEIHPTLNWGTVDIAGVDMTNRVIRQRDYKYGHMYVDAYENWQCVDYVVGVARHFGVKLDASWTVEMGVFQPRSYHPDGPRKIWPVNGAAFLDLASDLAYAARKTVEPEPEMKTGEYCLFCEGNHACPAYRRTAQKAIDTSMRGVPSVMTPDALGLMRTHVAAAIQRLEGLATGMDAQIEAEIRKNKAHVPGWELKPTEGRQEWTAPIDEVIILGDLLGVDARKKGAITPKQLIDKAKKDKIEIDEAVISAYSGRKVTTKVAPVDEKTAAKAFK